MKKKTRFTAAVISLFIAVVAGTQLVIIVKANPYHNIWICEGDTYADNSTEAPEISVISPQNKKVYTTDTVSLNLKVKVGDSNTAASRFLREIFCKADWLSTKFSIYNGSTYQTEFAETINLNCVPDGNHTLLIYAIESGRYITQRGPEGSGLNVISYAYYYLSFNITAAALVRFTVDATPPEITILEIENETFADSEVPLNFTVSESVSRISYVLNGQDNSTLFGNTTLTGLGNGEQSITVYAWDEAGNIGTSETVTFTIAKTNPIPTTLVIASVASVAIFGTGLLFYFKKRKRDSGDTK
jgi:hypothetical protein